jgi:glycerophosphoryl diester phosphodiesterase
MTEAWTRNTFIAHGLGGIGESRCTNSKEAFLLNYDRGYRVFEADLILTGDGEVAASHGWNKRPPLASEFTNTRIEGRYTPLTLGDLMVLLAEHPDCWLVVDCKETDRDKRLSLFKKLGEEAKAADVDGTLQGRVIPEIFDREMSRQVFSVCAFEQRIYSLYANMESTAEVLQSVSEMEYAAVAMPAGRAIRDLLLIRGLRGKGLPIYVHTVTNIYLLGWLSGYGITGYYTDSEKSPDVLHAGNAWAMRWIPAISKFMFGLIGSFADVWITARGKRGRRDDRGPH